MTHMFPQASRLGFGCASLGSRVGAKRGAEAIAMALDRGVNWFDVAPSYGDGQAEILLGRALKARRDAAHICTKCGIAAPAVSPLKALARPFARAIVAAAPDLRRIVAPARPAAQRQPITGHLIRTSLERSLMRLGVDYVDVLALHDPDPADLVRDDVRRAFEEVVNSGKARAVGVAGSFAAAAAALSSELPLRHLQFATDPGAVARLREVDSALEDRLVVTHSVSSRFLDPTTRAIEERRQAWRQALEGALLDNPDGVVLVSMFSAPHIEANVAVLQDLARKTS